MLLRTALMFSLYHFCFDDETSLILPVYSDVEDKRKNCTSLKLLMEITNYFLVPDKVNLVLKISYCQQNRVFGNGMEYDFFMGEIYYRILIRLMVVHPLQANVSISTPPGNFRKTRFLMFIWGIVMEYWPGIG